MTRLCEPSWVGEANDARRVSSLLMVGKPLSASSAASQPFL